MQKITVRENGTTKVVTINNQPSLAQQQFKDECDVNKIMKKYEQTGQIYHLNKKQGVYADLSTINNYQEMLHDIQKAEEAFDSLPAEVRYKFRNDPSQLITFLADPQNKEEAIKIGLIEKPNDDLTTITQTDVPKDK
jgi:phage internal scaffolding protein